ncbi:cyclic nucleotide-binding domain-containing protein [Alkalispirochaeta sphaeroplastigenens]|uniref:cyclic nucleotide-binding domain-containing protein n=1 Tax=Alkalispirochaeta sphaeroplastigenens TaxID=1187066 RepID=UPI0015E184B9|nr:cyclic nucleotide-binding domain-containing protein [Alkalispirochaeta sphaeroplastigenens]
MKKTRVSSGVFWVEIPEHDLRILCGCPADTVKHLMQRGFINTLEEGGVTFESGPNAILLSDVSVQNGEFANLSEFPVLQMLYRQGMIIQGHPNNKGQKPLIMGTAEQVAAQREYIYRGNYGLISEEEMIAAGLAPETAAEYMRIKKIFAFGTIRSPEELIDFRVIPTGPAPIVEGVEIERVNTNSYRISCGGESLEVSLNLGSSDQYTPPYLLSPHKIKPAYFSVVHTGEGDGWDPSRPCMASIITFQRDIYLIDAGPGVLHSLNALGISVNEIAGIFHTHAHDDHFAGLTSLVRADHRLRYYATPLVRASVTKKLAALMSFPEEDFSNYFDPCDLKEGEWNSIGGLEVRPVFSPHPVETTVMFFRALWEEGYRSYAHFADICSMKRLETFHEGASPEGTALAERVRREYLTPVNVKKLDIGGGLIHGEAEDFRDDLSERLVLAHKTGPLTDREKEIGTDTSFGMQDILIPASENADERRIRKHLRHNFPGACEHDLAMLANCPARTLSIGSILYRKENHPEQIYLLLDGLVEILGPEDQPNNILTPGSMIGEINCLTNTCLEQTYRAASFIYVLEIRPAMYLHVIEQNNLRHSIRNYLERKQFLMRTDLLGDRISGVTLNEIARTMEEVQLSRGETACLDQAMLLVAAGELEVRCGDRTIDRVMPGGPAISFASPLTEKHPLKYVAVGDVVAYGIPRQTIDAIPIARWKLLERFNRLCRNCCTLFQEDSP